MAPPDMEPLATPLVLLAVLTGPYLWVRWRKSSSDSRDAGAWGASLLFVFTASGHFVRTKAMTGMLPEWVPYRTAIILASGALELGLAPALVMKGTRAAAGALAIFLLIAFLPANVHAAFMGSPMGGGAMGPAYLLFRVPLQAFFIGWIYAFCARPALRNRPAVS